MPPEARPATEAPSGPASPAATAKDLHIAVIEAALPQTQCTRCGEPDCAAYARAIAEGAPINRCPPGGQEGIHRLAALTGRPALPLDPVHGAEGPRQLAWIDEAACIGCTLCIKACPVDCIVGAPKRMHTVVEADCTGCELCLPACPVDCIHLDVATPGLTGWQAWSPPQADAARRRYLATRTRRERDAAEELARLAAKTPTVPDADTIAAALARARARRAG